MAILRVFCLALCLFFVSGRSAHAAPDSAASPSAPSASVSPAFAVPELTGPVVDQAGVIDAETSARIEQALRDLYESGGSQIEVLTVPSLEGEAIEQASIKVVDKWKLGRKKDGTGALLMLSTGDHKVRIEVGQGLEGVLPDAIAKRIIDQKMTPLLRSGAISDALLVGTAAIVSVTDPTFDVATEFGAQSVRQSRGRGERDGPSGLVVIVFLIMIILMGAFGRRGGGGGFFIGGGGLGGGSFGGGGGSWGGGGGGFNGGGASGGW